MADITHADLQALGSQLTDAFRHEVQLLRVETHRMEHGIYRRIDELKDRQAEQNGRVGKMEFHLAKIDGDVSRQAAQYQQCYDTCEERGQAIATLQQRTKHISPHLGITLSRKQKAALWSIGGTLVVALADLFRHSIQIFMRWVAAHAPKP